MRASSVLGWLTRLYEAFNPQSHAQGSTAILDLSMIPGARETMKHWVRDALYTLTANYDHSSYLTSVLKLMSLIFTFDESSALRCIKQARFNTDLARVPQFVYSDPDGRYMLEDIVGLFDGTQQTCISSGLMFLRYAWYRNAGSFIALSCLQAHPQVFVVRGPVSFLRLFGTSCWQSFNCMAPLL